MVYHQHATYIRAHYGPVGLIKQAYALGKREAVAAAAKLKDKYLTESQN